MKFKNIKTGRVHNVPLRQHIERLQRSEDWIEVSSISEDELRLKAKEQGISHYWNKSIERLKEEVI